MIKLGILGLVYLVPCSSNFGGNAENEVNELKRQRDRDMCQNSVPDVDEIISRQLADS